MALDLTPDQKTVGQGNFHRVVGKLGTGEHTRRDFMRGMLAAGTALPLSAAAYYGYNGTFGGRPVKAGIIGAGDEGGVLVGEHNPRYLEFVAYSDIRPTNQARIFDGEPTGPRKGFNYHYGTNARASIRKYERYQDMLADADIEAVVIALPLNLHAEVAIAAMRAGKHVLCEKLMAWNVRQCKDMIRAADETGKVLSIGHQRHYSMLYAHANEIVRSNVLGEIRHIRALWHRNNATAPDGRTELVNGRTIPIYTDSWRKAVPAADAQHLRDSITQYGWKDVNQLVRWRLYRATGGGLMAELGSHQLDACSIFLEKKKPLAVSATGGKHFYQDDREIEDHVYCTFEFPGKNYDASIPSRDSQGNAVANDIVTVFYSSISTNDFEPYGECVMGAKGTLIVEQEQAAYLFARGSRNTSVSVSGGAAAALATSGSAPPDAGDRRGQEVGQAAIGHAPPSRGYKEEMEHFAYIIRNRDQAMESERDKMKPRCDGRAALGDAVMALTANIAMRDRTRIAFKPEWFDPTNDSTPEGDHPYRAS